MVSQLTKRIRRFALVRPDGSRRDPLLKGFHAPQRERRTLPWDEKPEHGVSQPMPPRSKP